MKLSEIETSAYEVIYPNGDGELYYMPHFAKARASEIEGAIRNLHTAEQMQEYAKECVMLAHQMISNDLTYQIISGHKKLKIVEVQKLINDIFEEDTKNE